MAKAPKVQKPQDIELVDDAWPRFERLVKAAAKIGHKPHVPTKKKKGTKKIERAR
jgi:hypothetical protein